MTKNNDERQIYHDPEQLRPLGWNDWHEERLAEYSPQPAARGRVARVSSVQRGLFLITDGRGEWLASPAGRVLRGTREEYPVTGDWVLADDVVVTAVLPRKNMLSRGESGARHGRAGGAAREQAIAANLDTVCIVCGLDRDFNIRRLERYLALVYNCGMAPVIVLTKADLHEDTEPFVWEVEAIAFGVPVVLASIMDGRGRDEVAGYLGPGRTVAMLGSSGAGKSSLANMLYGDDIQATGSVSAYDGKGRHTTTSRELIRMPQGGLLMDNPGIREIAFFESGEGLESVFADIAELAEACRFADCAHETEPGCAVLRAVENGGLPPERLESWRKMRREMDYLADRQEKGAERVEKERRRGIALLVKDIKKRKRK